MKRSQNPPQFITAKMPPGEDGLTLETGLESLRSTPPCGQRSCPMKADARRAALLSRDLASALRRLKRRYRRCVKSGCQLETCPYYSQVRTQIQTAIAQVLEEWVPDNLGQAGYPNPYSLD